MFEHFDTPQELFEYRLGSALSMEEDSLQMLGELEEAAHSSELKAMFRHHAGETRQQIENLQAVCSELGLSADLEPSQTTKGLAKEGSALIRKSGDNLVDSVAVAAALGTEHYEIAAYEALIAAAEGMGQTRVVDLLRANLAQEQHTSEELVAKAKQYAMAV
ncbi:hypothetical protein LK09_07410 [Microbacterium mangrovi]|uniref:Uncharacterized protein n=1 Tax=Microbacterium mangrovi TaxID=1348253 RepID=A0A0B2A7G0_9MICO|nr:DUF892 family protein [Microbacterium mangrovi]KHK99035.1 hypothetical protein LK09_07410 [Microbacterium mangrovi]